MRVNDAQGDFKILVDSWWDKLYHLAFAKAGGDRDAAYDIVQDVFIGVWEKWDAVPKNEEAEFYLLHALRYHVLNFYRSNTCYRSQMEQLELLFRHSETDTDNEEQELTDLRLKLTQTAISHLSPSLREVFVLRMEHGYSYQKIAALLKIEVGSARVLYSRALEQVRKSIAAQPAVALSFITALQLVTIS